MKIRFTRNWRQYPKGCIIEPGDAVAKVYLANGHAEVLDEPKRKRGRPPKVTNDLF